MARKILLILLFVGFTASLNACGRKNAPVAPEGSSYEYPGTYPAPAQEPKSTY